MPNTLGHLGVQTLISRGVLRGADIKWIWLACIVPDLPWIAQRGVRALLPGVDLIDLRLFMVVQSSLAFCLLLSAALALFSSHWLRSFGLLAAGSLMHLLLDAVQTKWANGVVLFAPFRWDLLNFGLFWPEDLPTAVLSLLGLAVAVHCFARLPKIGADLCRPRGGRALVLLLCLAIYLAGPRLLIPAAEAADLHFAGTLRDLPMRSGRAIEVDRGQFEQTPSGPALTIWTGEQLVLTGNLTEPGTVSIRGRFTDPQTVTVESSHLHAAGLRDYASYLGLLLILWWWGLCIAARFGEK